MRSNSSIDIPSEQRISDADILNNIKPYSIPYLYIGSSKEVGANRVVFGEAVNLVLDTLSKEEAAKKVMVIDSECCDTYGVCIRRY